MHSFQTVNLRHCIISNSLHPQAWFTISLKIALEFSLTMCLSTAAWGKNPSTVSNVCLKRKADLPPGHDTLLAAVAHRTNWQMRATFSWKPSRQCQMFQIACAAPSGHVLLAPPAAALASGHQQQGQDTVARHTTMHVCSH